MHNGWFIHDGEHISQFIVLPSDNLTVPGKPKGVKLIFQECRLWRTGLLLKCYKSKQCYTDCCASMILSTLLDFLTQGLVFSKSLKILDTCASSYQNFNVSWTLLSSFEVLSRDICISTVITHLIVSKPASQKLLTQLNSVQCGSGNIGWLGECQYTEEVNLTRIFILK
jgi:hypothetical protein